MERSAWRWFPLALTAAMLVVFAVNGYFIYVALNTFPGAAGKDGFDLSNNYDRILARIEKQAELGWRLEAAADSDHHAVLRLVDRNGAPIEGAAIRAAAERPVGPADTTELPFHETGQHGTYVADTTLFSGQWDVLLTVNADGETYTTTRRVVVR